MSGNRPAVHRPSFDGDASRLLVALALILALMAAEVLVGVLSHSLALLADAGHMLTDVLAIGASLVAARLASRPPTVRLTYGFGRAEALSAQFNGVTLLVLACVIVYVAITRLVSPPATDGVPMLAVALAGIVVNLIATRQLSHANRESMSVEGSFQHILTDLYAFIGTSVAAGVILATGFMRADAIASLLVAALMLRSSYRLLRDSARVFLEAAPKGLDPKEIGFAMAGVADVGEVHDLHVWQVGSGSPMLSAHVLVGVDQDCHAARRRLEAMLSERFAIEHTTLQVDHSGSELLEIEVSPAVRSGE